MNTYIDPEVKAELDLMAALHEQAQADSFDDATDNIVRNANGRIITGPDGADDQLSVIFTSEAKLDRKATYYAKGVPQYTDVDFVTICAPGQARNNMVYAAVTPYYEWRFPVEYKRFKEGQASVVTGMPLSLWPLLTPTQVKDLEYAGVRTIEQLSTLSDSVNIPNLQKLKSGAKAFLEQAKDMAASGRLQAELDERDKQHTADMDAMKAQQAELLKRLDELTKADKKKSP